MTRRSAVRQATLLVFGMCLGKMDVIKAANGQLTVDLDQWGTVVFKHHGKTIAVPVSEIFASLANSSSNS
jgi:hypothetical protein